MEQLDMDKFMVQFRQLYKYQHAINDAIMLKSQYVQNIESLVDKQLEIDSDAENKRRLNRLELKSKIEATQLRIKEKQEMLAKKRQDNKSKV